MRQGRVSFFTQNTNIKELPKTLEAIFGKSYTPEETKVMVKTYQDLLKIEDQKTFIEQAFQQIKTDMGLDDVKVPLEIVKKQKNVEHNVHILGSASFISVSIAEDVGKQKILNSIAHELEHVRQNKEMVQAGFYEHFINDDVIKEWIKSDFPEFDANKPRDLKKISGYVQKLFSDAYGDVKKSTIRKGTPRYQEAEEYLKAKKSKDTSTYKSYRNNLLEVKAFSVGDAMERFAEVIRYYKP